MSRVSCPKMRPLPDPLLDEHGCKRPVRELPYQQVLRLNQALWREEQGFPIGGLGSCVEATSAKATGYNLMSDAARRLALSEVQAAAEQDKVVESARLYENLLSTSVPVKIRGRPSLQRRESGSWAIGRRKVASSSRWVAPFFVEPHRLSPATPRGA